jgi:hypothetical protein
MIEHNRCDNCHAFTEDNSLCEQCQKLIDDDVDVSDAFQNQNIPEGK